MLRAVVLSVLFAFVILCVGPTELRLVEHTASGSVRAPRKSDVPAFSLDRVTAQVRVTTPDAPFELGFVRALFDFARPGSEVETTATVSECATRVEDRRQLIRRLCRSQHRPMDAPLAA